MLIITKTWNERYLFLKENVIEVTIDLASKDDQQETLQEN